MGDHEPPKSGDNSRTEEGKTSFWALAIRSRQSAWRAGILATWLLFFGGLLAGTLTWFIIKIVSPVADEVDVGEGHLAFKLKHGKQTVSVVSVPAYQLAVPTGVTISRKTQIKITAQGLVLTIGGLSVAPTNASTLETNAKRFLMFTLDRDSNPDWRLPDGTTYYTTPKTDESDSQEEKPARLRPKVNYGCLLAFVGPPGIRDPESLFELMAKPETRFIEIGNECVLEYNDEAKRYTATSDPGNDYILQDGGEIYLTINDKFVRESSDVLLSTNDRTKILADETKGKANQDLTKALEQANIDADRAAAYRASQKEISDTVMRKPYGIWYLDNRGAFTVTLDATPKE